jgi:hypothetical protein
MTEEEETEEEENPFAEMSKTKPRHVVFLDEFVGTMIGVLQVLDVHIETPKRPAQPKVTIMGIDPYSFDQLTYVGEGKTLGHCLRAILDQVNERFPLGGIYGSPEI